MSIMNDDQRQQSFKRLREPCVELHSVGTAFRGKTASAEDVTRALEPFHSTLKELAEQNKLDAKLAEYAFFPLTHIFNDTQRVPTRCLEQTVQCLQILVTAGWGRKIPPSLGKEFIIFLTLLVGGSPSKVGQQPSKKATEELSIAGFECLQMIFNVLEGPGADDEIYHKIGSATVVDQTVYVLLDGIADERSDDVCVAAARALHALYLRITDRVVLASIMPRTISTLAKVVKPTTQTRRSYKLLDICLQISNNILQAVLNDRVIAQTEKATPLQLETDKLTLDQSWLKATTTQIKLALVNLIQVRRHQRPEVQDAMLKLCVMVIEECQVSLKDAVPLMVDTVVVLADKEDASNEAYNTLINLLAKHPIVLDSLQESVYEWLKSFPRIMQSNDETAKQWGIRQISTAFQALFEVKSMSDILLSSLASGLGDSIAVVVKLSKSEPQILASTTPESLNLDIMGPRSLSLEFGPVLLEHQSQQQTLRDLQSMITRLNLSESGNAVTRLIVNRLQAKSDETVVGPLWLALTSLRAQSKSMAVFDDFLVDDLSDQSLSLSKPATMIDELYYNSFLILNDLPADGSGDWRTLALALEAVSLQAQQLGEAFRPELMDALYPTLQLLASNNPVLQQHSMTCLNILTKACNYPDTRTMVIENADYLVNSIALKLNTFDVSPYPPQVLFIMVKLCGPQLIPYLDDVVDSIFGIVDMYHGYPKLVELLFKSLAAIVEEGARNSSLLTIDNGRESGPRHHRKIQHQHLSISTIAANILKRKSKSVQHDEEEVDAEGKKSHPKKPWSETYDKPPPEPQTVEELLNQAESDEPLPPPKEPEDTEKPLSKTHALLLHIVKSIPSHLSSPSPYLRRSLLAILIDVLPTLSQNENSFLPLINDLWPSVASRVIFPSSLASESSSNSLITQDTSNSIRPANQPDTQVFQEETFVIKTACEAIEAMCKGAGDFMASRIEPEFPRWERLYQRVWTKVKQEAEAANNRRDRQQRLEKQEQAGSNAPKMLIQDMDTDKASTSTPKINFEFTSSLALSPLTSGSRAFTPHHTLWRALISLFLAVLTHVRLPPDMGDRICEILGAWIALFVGPAYYFHSSRNSDPAAPGLAGLDDAQKSMLDSVDYVIRAMETWNEDLTWFIFQRQQSQLQPPASRQLVSQHEVEEMNVEIDGVVLAFAKHAF
ncbi:Armadillo-like helical [Penicillium verhagenii]|uniref:Armadillo-like helical n=1 Tax=Penicillium verhagenii TaxID=1562060 RepID=UPI0025454F45|nr:Armadillo-like helical [Penicillium verhagenii]KAJ5921170.1 Armadillo-like helical [Penicillium verhagenii]